MGTGAPKLCMTRPAPTREGELTGNKGGLSARDLKIRPGANGVLRRPPEGGSDAHSGFGDFDDRDGLDGGAG